MASQVSSGTLGKAHDFSGSWRRPTPPLEVLPKARRRREASPCDLGRNLQTSGRCRNRPQGPVMAQPKAPTAPSKGRTSGGSGRPPGPHPHPTLRSPRCSSPPPRPGDPAYLPHEVVVLADVHVLRSDDTASEGAHLGAGLDPRLGENAKALAGDGALRDDHLGRQHQAGQLLNLCGRQAGGLSQSGRQGGPALPPHPPPPRGWRLSNPWSLRKQEVPLGFISRRVFLCLFSFWVSPRILRTSTTALSLHFGQV